MNDSNRQVARTDVRRPPFSWPQVIVFLGAIVLVNAGVSRLGQQVSGVLDAAGFLTGPGADGLMEVAGLPVLAVLFILFVRRDLIGDRGLRLGAMGLGAGAGILLADPVARIILYFGMSHEAGLVDGGMLRLTVNLAVLAIVAVLFVRAVTRELRLPGRGASLPPDEEQAE